MKEAIKNINPSLLVDIVSLRKTVVLLLNLVEEHSGLIESLKKENQELKDEINRLKGEQGKPVFNPKEEKAAAANTGATDSEAGEKKPKRRKKNKGTKKDKIPIDRTQMCLLDKGDLPADATFKYYDEVIQQDVKLVRENVLYKVAVYYSPSTGKTYRGELPSDYVGEFGLSLQSLTQLLYHYCDVTQQKLRGLYTSVGVSISSGTINNILLKKTDWALEEQKQILQSGLSNSPYSQIDSTKSVERGVRKATQIICAEFFSVFYTMDSKSRLDVLGALLGKPESGLQVVYNEQSRALLNHFGVSQKDQLTLSQLLHEGQVLSLMALQENLQQAAPHIAAKKNIFSRIMESMALGYYHSQEDLPVVEWLVSDDAPEYKKIATQRQGLCWIHDNRHYKKLIPKIQVHQDTLEQIQQEYWTFYGKLLKYKALSKADQLLQKPLLVAEFDRIFSQQTNYFQVNTCLERTLKNKTQLLAVLDLPALPLHNNAAELEARRIVRKRDISLHTWSAKGTKVRDAFMSIIQTANKLNISALDYIKDRVGRKYEMTPLAILIKLAYAEFTSTY